MDERSKLLKRYNAYAFAAYDWNLYLDTHPNDKGAIAMFRKMADKAKTLKEEYQAKYGPLTADASTDTERWNWIDNPWPWDNF